MSDLGRPLSEAVRSVVEKKHKGDQSLERLVNDVISDTTDFEHVVTFLDESPSALHRAFADDLRREFETVLKKRLKLIERELGGAPTVLYQALLDMYQVKGCPEELIGLLTLNYDDYIEQAARQINQTVDFGITLQNARSTKSALRLLKLHGSFGWRDAFPITLGKTSPTLWIPPGIQKAKNRYPFNVLWGLAREVLDCDVLRIVGCRLGPNDWDLISLIFSTRHTRSKRRPYEVEVIDAPSHAVSLQKSFPYLEVRSILEVEPIGSRLVSEFTGGAPRSYLSMDQADRKKVRDAAGTQNWFRLWLKQMAEHLYTELGSVETQSKVFEQLLEAK